MCSPHKIATKYKRVLSGDEQRALFEQFFVLKKLLLNYNLLYHDLDSRKGLDAIANISEGINKLAREHPEYRNAIAKASRAKDKLILHNYRLVIGEAHRNRDKGMSEEDLIGAGTAGLNYALFKFNPNIPDIKFSSYAVFWVKEFIKEELRAKESIKYPYKNPPQKFILTSLSRAEDEEYSDIFEVSIPIENAGLLDELYSLMTDEDAAFLSQYSPKKKTADHARFDAIAAKLRTLYLAQ